MGIVVWNDAVVAAVVALAVVSWIQREPFGSRIGNLVLVVAGFTVNGVLVPVGAVFCAVMLAADWARRRDERARGLRTR
jgi:hypothetical protein